MSHYATVVPVVTRSMLTAAQLLGSIERDVADLRASVRTTNSCRDDQQELVRLLSADNNVLKSEAQYLREELRLLQEERQKERETFAEEFEQQRMACVGELDRLLLQYSQLQEERDRLENHLQSEKFKAQQLEVIAGENSKFIDENNAYYEELDTKYGKLTEEYRELYEYCHSLEASNQSLTVRIHELEQSITTSNSGNSQSRYEHNHVSYNQVSTRDNSEEMPVEAATLSAAQEYEETVDYNYRKDQDSAVNSENSAVNSENSAVNSENSDVNSENSDVNSENSDVNSAVNSYNGDYYDRNGNSPLAENNIFYADEVSSNINYYSEFYKSHDEEYTKRDDDHGDKEANDTYSSEIDENRSHTVYEEMAVISRDSLAQHPSLFDLAQFEMEVNSVSDLINRDLTRKKSEKVKQKSFEEEFSNSLASDSNSLQATESLREAEADSTKFKSQGNNASDNHNPSSRNSPCHRPVANESVDYVAVEGTRSDSSPVQEKDVQSPLMAGLTVDTASADRREKSPSHSNSIRVMKAISPTQYWNHHKELWNKFQESQSPKSNSNGYFAEASQGSDLFNRNQTVNNKSTDPIPTENSTTEKHPNDIKPQEISETIKDNNPIHNVASASTDSNAEDVHELDEDEFSDELVSALDSSAQCANNDATMKAFSASSSVINNISMDNSDSTYHCSLYTSSSFHEPRYISTRSMRINTNSLSHNDLRKQYKEAHKESKKELLDNSEWVEREARGSSMRVQSVKSIDYLALNDTDVVNNAMDSAEVSPASPQTRSAIHGAASMGRTLSFSPKVKTYFGSRLSDASSIDEVHTGESAGNIDDIQQRKGWTTSSTINSVVNTNEGVPTKVNSSKVEMELDDSCCDMVDIVDASNMSF